MKIGITEAGDAGLDLSWKDKLDNYDSAILITKHVTDKFIDAVLPFKDKVIIHATCTGFGNTAIEPNVPDPETQLNQIDKLIARNFPRENIVIRIDPIIPNKKGLAAACKVFIEAYKRNHRRFRVSILDMYPHARERFRKAGLKLPYGDYFTASDNMFKEADRMFESLKITMPDITIESCAEDKLNIPEKIGCLSKKDLDLMHINYDINNIDNAGYQRKSCLCCSAKTELLNNKKPCAHKCLYCYWKDS